MEDFCTDLYKVDNKDKKYEAWTKWVTDKNESNREKFKNIKNEAFTYREIKVIIRSLKNNKAYGIDGITNEALKMLDEKNLKMLLFILNKMYEAGVVPEDWNTGIITTIYKNKGKRGDPKN